VLRTDIKQKLDNGMLPKDYSGH